ncbi:MAG: hypothetical protein HY648_10450 [Acidobacteria bacterium]|nr:hypothetical protein [Acidobacteriota bacterium]
MKSLTVKEYVQVHNILSAVVEHKLGNLRVIPERTKELLQARDAHSSEEADTTTRQQWLKLLDLAVTPFELRSYVTEAAPDEQALQLLIRFLIFKESHSQADIEKVDWLLTHLFRSREQKGQQQGAWYKNEIQDLLGNTEPLSLSRETEELLAEIPPLLEEIRYAEKFAKLTEARVVERGRELKNRFGEEFFHPIVLAAIVNYNLLVEKQFQKLFREAAQQAPKTGELRETVLDPDKVLQTDYRAVTQAFWQVGESERKRMEEEEAERQKAKDLQEMLETAPATMRPEPTADESFEQKLARRGVDARRQAQRLRDRHGDMTARFQKNPTFTSMPTGTGVLALTDWEANALRLDFFKGDESFRAQIAREISYSMAIVVSIQEELAGYYATKGTEHLWKTHCEALCYLFHEGERQAEPLEKLVAESRKRGLLEKSNQIAQTAAKLHSALAKIRALNEPAWLSEPLP